MKLNLNGIRLVQIENKISITEDKEKIIIYVAGAVKNEGIYELDENSRIADCIEKAGGLTEDAYIKDINLAYVLEDGMKVYIPKNSDKNERKDDFKYFKENKDGSICAKIPLKWIKINAGSKEGRVMTEEQKEAARIRLANARKKMGKK